MRIIFLVTVLGFSFSYYPICQAGDRSATQFGFIENKGQIINVAGEPNDASLYQLKGKHLNIHLRKNGFSYETVNIEHAEPDGTFGRKFARSEAMAALHRVDVSWVNGSKAPEIIAKEEAPDYINYFTSGLPSDGVTQVRHYGRILYKNVYDKVDIEFIVTAAGAFKYNLIVHPGGKLGDIRLLFAGANKVELKPTGEISIETGAGNFSESIPESYEEEATGHSPVNVRYVSLGNNEFGFQTDDRNENATLVIDPWATYFGGSGDEQGIDVITDALGNVYATGTTWSASNIATSGAYQSSISGLSDVYIVKFNNAGVRQWSTYYGGFSDDGSLSISLDNNNSILITGYTLSSSNISTPGTWQTGFIGVGGLIGDGFVAKFSNAGSLIWGTYYGGAGNDYTTGIAADGAGNIYVSGYTLSNTNIASPGAYEYNYQGGATSYEGDAFLAKFNSSGQRVWATYYGGNRNDIAADVALDPGGNPVICGITVSTNKMASAGAYQTVRGGSQDGFLAKFDTAGNRLWGTYLGGSYAEWCYALAIDTSGNIIAVGATESSDSISTIGAHQFWVAGSGEKNGFIQKLDPAGGLLWGTYFASYNASIDGVVTDDSCSIYISGDGDSLTTVSTPGVHQPAVTGSFDAFVAKFTHTGTQVWGTYFGGANTEQAYGISVSTGGNVYITGNTLSTTHIASPGAHQIAFGGGTPQGDAFIASFSPGGLVWPGIFNNTINSQTSVCAGQMPAPVTGSTPQAFYYQIKWYSSSTGPNTNFVQVLPVLPPNYQPPALFTTTWFRRVIVTQNGEADTSNADSTVVIQNPVPTVYQVGNILSTDPYSGYQWEKNSVNIPGATSQSYVVTSPGAYSVGVDSAGCWGYSQEVVVSSVDVDDLEYNNSVSVAPNPARNQITVRATQSEVGAGRIMDLLGRIVKTFSLKEKGTVVDVSDLNSGTYILIVPGSPHSYPLKLFIE